MSNSDVHLTITKLHTEVSGVASGGDEDQAPLQCYRQLHMKPEVVWGTNQRQEPPANRPFANCHLSQSGAHTPDKCQSIITGLTNTPMGEKPLIPKHNKSTMTVVTEINRYIKQPFHTKSR